MEASRQQPLPSLFWSSAIHALLFLLILYYMNQEGGSHSRSPLTVQIDSIQEKHKVKTRKVSVTQKSQSSGATAQRDQSMGTVSLANLGMRLNPVAVTETETLARSPSVATPETDLSEDWDLLNPDPRIARFNRYLYQTVQGWLDRESARNIDSLYGTVKIRISFDENGKYLEEETVLGGIDSRFKEIVARALRKSFEDPIPRPYLFANHKITLERQVVIRQ